MPEKLFQNSEFHDMTLNEQLEVDGGLVFALALLITPITALVVSIVGDSVAEYVSNDFAQTKSTAIRNGVKDAREAYQYGITEWYPTAY